MATKKKKDADPTGAGKDGPVQSSDSEKIVEKSSLATAAKDVAAGDKAKDGKEQAGGNKTMGKDKASSKDEQGEERKSLAEQIKSVAQFLKEVVIEFRKISWPGRAQVLKETWSVLFLVAAITLMVLGFDWFLNHAVFMPLEDWARLHGGGYGGGFGQGPK
jgi:preprotein translocase SecE subunit